MSDFNFAREPASDEEFASCTGKAVSTLDGIEWESFNAANMAVDSKQLDEIAALIETLCSACNSEQRARILNENGVWSMVGRLMNASKPTEELSKFKAQVPPDMMAKILAAAQKGEEIKKEDLSMPTQENLTEEERHGKELLQDWSRLRRATLGVLRNALRYPNTNMIKESVASESELVQHLSEVSAEVLEEGVNVSYSFTILRFLVTNESPEKGVTAWQRSVVSECIRDPVLDYIIGSAVTSRVIHLPDGTKLWVHMEATRLVASLVLLVDKEELPRLLLATRALCDGILLTKNIAMHIEMGRCLLRLIEDCPNASRAVFKKEASEPVRPLNLMIEFNDRRIIHSFLGMLIMGTNAYLSDKTEESKQSVLLSLRLLHYIGEECADQLLAQDAEKILSTIAPAIPEAKDVLAYINANASEPTEPVHPAESEKPTASRWFYCPLL